jgi:hypothetical protein
MTSFLKKTLMKGREFVYLEALATKRDYVDLYHGVSSRAREFYSKEGTWGVAKGFTKFLIKDVLLPRPDLSFKEAQSYADEMFESLGRHDYASVVSNLGGMVGKSISTVFEVVPGVSAVLSKSTRASRFMTRNLGRSEIVGRHVGRSEKMRQLADSFPIKKDGKLLPPIDPKNPHNYRTPSAWKTSLKKRVNPFSGQGRKAIKRAIFSQDPKTRAWGLDQVESRQIRRALQSKDPAQRAWARDVIEGNIIRKIKSSNPEIRASGLDQVKNKLQRKALESNDPIRRKKAIMRLERQARFKNIKSGYELAHPWSMPYEVVKYEEKLAREAWKKSGFKTIDDHKTQTSIQRGEIYRKWVDKKLKQMEKQKRSGGQQQFGRQNKMFNPPPIKKNPWDPKNIHRRSGGQQSFIKQNKIFNPTITQKPWKPLSYHENRNPFDVHKNPIRTPYTPPRPQPTIYSSLEKQRMQKSLQDFAKEQMNRMRSKDIYKTLKQPKHIRPSPPSEHPRPYRPNIQRVVFPPLKGPPPPPRPRNIGIRPPQFVS